MMGLNRNVAHETPVTMSQSSGGSSHTQQPRQPRGRGLEHAARNVDWADDGNMHDIKNQGMCGSCSYFTTTTVLEGTISIKTGRDPVRLSEQQSTDCTLRETQYNIDLFGKDYGCWGCDGCWMSNSCNFMEDQGVMLESDYPYMSGNSGTEY